MSIYHTIVIPTAFRVDYLDRCLISLADNIDDFESTEVIVVDNNAAINISGEVKNLCANSIIPNLVYSKEPRLGQLYSRHRGLELARGEIITFIDDDVIVSPSWSSAICDAFKDPELTLLGGPSLPIFNSEVPKWFYLLFMRTPYGGLVNTSYSLLDIGRDVEFIDPVYAFGLNYTILKSDLMELGGFNPDVCPPDLQYLQGDGETGLSYKVAAAHKKASYSQAALLYHSCFEDRLTTDYIEKRFFYQGVADSYTSIRNKRFFLTLFISVLPIAVVSAIFFKNIFRSLGRMLKFKFFSFGFFYANAKQYVDGYRWHSQFVKVHPELLKWVKKPKYIDFRSN